MPIKLTVVDGKLDLNIAPINNDEYQIALALTRAIEAVAKRLAPRLGFVLWSALRGKEKEESCQDSNTNPQQ